MILRSCKDAQRIVPRYEPLAAESERRQHVRCDVGEHAGALVRYERNTQDGGCDARREPRREIRQRLDSDVRHVASFECIESGADDLVVPRARRVAKHAQLVAEWASHGRIDGVIDCAQGRPQCMNAQILIEVGGVVQRNSLEALQICGELVEFSETATALLFHVDLNLADPATLEFNPLGNDFLLQTEERLV
jgi:hypothetical protein